MRLCMFHPFDHPLERGWVGRIDGERVVHLAAQTLQSFFTGGGSAREHAEYPLAEVCLLAPVLHPPSVRVFDEQGVFEFANPAAIVGPRSEIPVDGPPLRLLPRVAALIGADGAIGGFTVAADWRRPDLRAPKDRDFALGLGPLLVTPDELDLDGIRTVVRVDRVERLDARLAGFDWRAARDLAATGTALRPGDVLAGPSPGVVEPFLHGSVEVDVAGIGVLVQGLSA